MTCITKLEENLKQQPEYQAIYLQQLNNCQKSLVQNDAKSSLLLLEAVEAAKQVISILAQRYKKQN
ncbi:EscE/YscE/SsaE family type III secretion system needle protein co-chaperone [Arsenophonus apicola]|uniref:EscE/YscE/SsaE family type III secretion system needle protein co-chaperone n=1 Tax=Arsenophonus apicola TaxID=2879119 RepID=A0ABY8P363_9GAMM|nr:EscE/YscE/SsaE family type III secretion system needle protein co-chaperone [Arsenophonus apicola]WGO83940.1 EscE/YscE/SsaE family type III secretion system needle protein co-chaperone [Arsenophonus apicola]